ncbi:unnamed protein product [Penicillium glandicola]
MSTNADHEDPIANFHVSRIPYNEDTIVKIINETYHLYQQLNYIATWELIWPPEGGHVINQALCEELHLDPAVISLMKRLPYIRWSQLASDIPFMRFSRPFVYLEDDEIRGGRDPDRFQVDEPRIDFLLPHEIALTCSTDEGSSAIMDLKENTIRVWDFNDGPPGDDPDNYRAYPPFHAPTFLSTHLEKIRSLEIIPSGTRNVRDLWDKHYEEEYLKIKRTLQEQFGWPYDFREEEWKAVAKVTWERIIRDEPDFELDPDDSDLPPGMEEDPDFNGPFPQTPR